MQLSQHTACHGCVHVESHSESILGVRRVGISLFASARCPTCKAVLPWMFEFLVIFTTPAQTAWRSGTTQSPDQEQLVLLSAAFQSSSSLKFRLKFRPGNWLEGCCSRKPRSALGLTQSDSYQPQSPGSTSINSSNATIKPSHLFCQCQPNGLNTANEIRHRTCNGSALVSPVPTSAALGTPSYRTCSGKWIPPASGAASR